MPNWCDNILAISHKDKEKIKKSAEAYNQGTLLEYLYPIKNIEGIARDAISKKWGTRSDIENNGDQIDVEEAYKAGSFTARFATAWSPPLGAMRKAEKIGYKIKLFYLEDSLAFAGMFEDGEDDCYDLSDYTSKDVESSLPSELVECFDIAFLLSNLEDENDEEEEEEEEDDN